MSKESPLFTVWPAITGFSLHAIDKKSRLEKDSFKHIIKGSL